MLREALAESIEVALGARSRADILTASKCQLIAPEKFLKKQLMVDGTHGEAERVTAGVGKTS